MIDCHSLFPVGSRSHLLRYHFISWCHFCVNSPRVTGEGKNIPQPSCYCYPGLTARGNIYLGLPSLAVGTSKYIQENFLVDTHGSAYTRVKFPWCLPHALKNLFLPVEKNVVEKETQMILTFFPSNASNPCFLVLPTPCLLFPEAPQISV